MSGQEYGQMALAAMDPAPAAAAGSDKQPEPLVGRMDPEQELPASTPVDRDQFTAMVVCAEDKSTRFKPPPSFLGERERGVCCSCKTNMDTTLVRNGNHHPGGHCLCPC